MDAARRLYLRASQADTVAHRRADALQGRLDALTAAESEASVALSVQVMGYAATRPQITRLASAVYMQPPASVLTYVLAAPDVTEFMRRDADADAALTRLQKLVQGYSTGIAADRAHLADLRSAEVSTRDALAAASAETARDDGTTAELLVTYLSAEQAADTSAAVEPSGVPATAMAAYREAALTLAGTMPWCGLTWPDLAAIGQLESNHGRTAGSAATPDGEVLPPILGPALDGASGRAALLQGPSDVGDGPGPWVRAVGPMQFLPSTWRSLGRTTRAGGPPDPNNLFDAALTAGTYLCLASGGALTDPAGLNRAYLSYNHDPAYAAAASGLAQFYGGAPDPSAPPPG